MLEELITPQKLHREGKLHKQLQIRLAVFIALTIVFGVLAFHDFVLKDISTAAELGIFSISFLVGLVIFSRMAKISWDEKKEVMNIERLDKVGFIILALFVLFRIGTNYYLEHSYENVSIITGLTFASIFGGMLGRLIGMLSAIHRAHKGESMR